jgi:pimeloyl-ACP methyl ester carboxylesterase
LIPELDASLLTRHLTRVSGVHLHWAEAGRGRPTILLHGVCDSHRAWRKVVPALSRSRRLLMPDLPGHGLSDRPDAPYTVDWYGWMVGAWIDSLGLRSFDLVGHSYGGGVAQMLLLTHAGRIDRLALVGSGGLGHEVSFALRLWSALRSAERVAQPLVARGTRVALASLLPGSDPEDVDFMSWMNAMPGTGRALSRTVQAAIDWKGQKLQFFDRAAELPRLLPRMALFWGNRDPIIPVEHAKALVARAEHITLTEFEGCGHWPQLEQPEAFAVALSAFLGDPAWARARLRDVTPIPALPRWRRLLRALWRWLRSRLAALAARWSRRTLPPPP